MGSQVQGSEKLLQWMIQKVLIDWISKGGMFDFSFNKFMWIIKILTGISIIMAAQYTLIFTLPNIHPWPSHKVTDEDTAESKCLTNI